MKIGCVGRMTLMFRLLLKRVQPGLFYGHFLCVSLHLFFLSRALLIKPHFCLIVNTFFSSRIGFISFFFQLHFSHENQIGTIETEWLPAYFPSEQVAYSLSYYWFNFLLLTATSVSIYAREKKTRLQKFWSWFDWKLRRCCVTCGETKYQLQTIDFFVLRHTNHYEQQQQQQCQQKKLSFWYWTHVSKSIWDNKMKHRCHSSCYSFTALAWLSCEKKHTHGNFFPGSAHIFALTFFLLSFYTPTL